jgi:hypothetical protein
MIYNSISEYCDDHQRDISKQYIPYPTYAVETSEVADESPEICVERSSHGKLEILDVKVSESSKCRKAWNTCEYLECESGLLVDHVEYVDILDAYRIVEIFTPESIFEIDDTAICRKIIVENLAISNYYIIFVILDVDPGLCLPRIGGFSW